MEKALKNRFVYCALAFLPLALLVILTKNQYINSLLFVWGLLFYALVYRSILDYMRLKSKKAIDPNASFWNLFIPGIRIKYFKELYGA